MKIINLFFDKIEREEIFKETLEKLEELREENEELRKENEALKKERIHNLKNIYENEESIYYFFQNGIKVKLFAVGKKNKLLAISKGEYGCFEVSYVPNEEYYIFRKKLEEKENNAIH